MRTASWRLLEVAHFTYLETRSVSEGSCDFHPRIVLVLNEMVHVTRGRLPTGSMHLNTDATRTYLARAVMMKERGPLGTRLNEE